jgi:hypothetical protein
MGGFAMKGLVSLVAITVVPAILLLSAFSVSAIEHKYIEDFTTTQYKDTLNTTAWWDTLSGELKLPPFELGLAGSYDTPGLAIGVCIDGDYAYIADENSGLQVIDISDPTSPLSAGSFNTSGYAQGVAIAGDHAYVADGAYGLQVIDISNPTVPLLAGSCDTPGGAFAVALSGDYAYVADATSGLIVIDISDPATPTLAGSYDTPGAALGVVVDGDYVYVADQTAGLRVIDISDPTNPAPAGSYDTPGYAMGVAIAGDHAYVADAFYGLQVIDISDPTSPVLAGTYGTPGWAYGVAVSGDRAYVADYSYGLYAIDISDPALPLLAGNLDTSGNAYAVAVAGEYAYVADEASGLEVIRISDPVSPKFAGTYNTPGQAYGVAVSGDHGFVAEGYSGLQVIDISDSGSPTLVGTYNTPGSAYEIAVSGDHAFVADAASGLLVIDISDPTTPTLVGTRDTPGQAYGVAVSGDYAFVADGYSGLQVIDISDPTTPTLVGTYDTPTMAGDVVVSGDHAFVTGDALGLYVIDISDPTNPTLAKIRDTPGYARVIAVSGDRAFVADYYALQLIDISDPTNPALAGTYDTPGIAYGVAVSGNYAYVADEASGLQVIQVYQSEVDLDNNVGRSLSVYALLDTIFGARLVTTQTNAVTWELSADGGVSWQAFAPNGSWNQFTVPGINPVWRSTHTWVASGVNPTVTRLEIDWLVEPALIDSIVDVPGDQGGWVRMHFTRSGRDFADEATLPISNYGIWRRVESAALVAALETQAPSKPERSAAVDDAPELGGLPVITYQGRMYVQSRPGLAASSFPPGTWEWLTAVSAVQHDIYIAAVPTVTDSSAYGMNYTVFLLTAHTTTPSIWYVSEPDSGYSLDNIAPAVPKGFAVAYNTGSGNALSWDPSPDEDFQHFRVYRSSDPDFVPSPSDLVHSLTGTSWSDPDYDGWSVYYKITALDYVGNESDPASPGTTTAVEEPVIPQMYVLYPNVPNPFNPSTTIRYDVPAGGGAVTLRIYDVSGRLVRTLQDGPQAAGQKTAVWNGRDDRGRGVVSGVYFYRLEAPGYRKTLKMILIQ